MFVVEAITTKNKTKCLFFKKNYVLLFYDNRMPVLSLLVREREREKNSHNTTNRRRVPHFNFRCAPSPQATLFNFIISGVPYIQSFWYTASIKKINKWGDMQHFSSSYLYLSLSLSLCVCVSIKNNQYYACCIYSSK